MKPCKCNHSFIIIVIFMIIIMSILRRITILYIILKIYYFHILRIFNTADIPVLMISLTINI